MKGALHRERDVVHEHLRRERRRRQAVEQVPLVESGTRNRGVIGEGWADHDVADPRPAKSEFVTTWGERPAVERGNAESSIAMVHDDLLYQARQVLSIKPGILSALSRIPVHATRPTYRR
jgi:hypothetical protein